MRYKVLFCPIKSFFPLPLVIVCLEMLFKDKRDLHLSTDNQSRSFLVESDYNVNQKKIIILEKYFW